MSIKKVVTWVNEPKKTLWWRQAVRLALKNGILTEDNLEDLYKLAQMEAGAIDKSDNYDKDIEPVEVAGFDIEESPVHLLSISNVKNVSTLVEDQTLSFDSTGLTAVYGDNGSGKSSYSKILKNACLTRGDTPRIISNIYDPKADTAGASLCVQIGTKDPLVINWLNDNSPNEDLKSIRVFDSNSSSHYISKEDTIEYKPASLKVLDELTRACEFIKGKVAREKIPLTKKGELPTCIVGTQAQDFLTNLNHSTTKEQLEAICMSQEETDSIDVLMKELIVLQTNTPQKLREKYSKQYKELEPLHTHFVNLKKVLSEEALKELRTAYDDYQTKKQAAELARQKALDGHALNNICSDAWQSMWRHVEAFIKTNNQGYSFPPAQGEPCPTCLQVITEDAASKLASFNDYLQDKTQKEAAKAKQVFEQHQKTIRSLYFDLNPYSATLEQIKGFKSEIAEKLKQLNSALKTCAQNVLLEDPVLTALPVDYVSMDWIGKQIDRFKEKEKEVKDNASLKAKIQDEQARIKELRERQKITEAKELILQEIRRLKTSRLLKNINDSCSYASATSLVTFISKDGSVGQLNAVFQKEIKELGFKGFNVETGTRGSKGQQLLKIQLAGKVNKIPEIASEGEQKCISLAGFLAELTVDERKSAIIFDDPINSLDHHWRRKFADRIAKESKVRQVIVLTHDLAFLKMLDESVAKEDSKLRIVAIRKHGNQAGYPMSTPPWGLMKTTARVGVLKNTLPVLKKKWAMPDPVHYHNEASILYNKKRETWERLVEEILLKGIVERFGRDVKTQNIKYIADDITQDDVATIHDAMSKCSTFMVGHDRALELGFDFPDYDEIESDVLALEAYTKALNKRRK